MPWKELSRLMIVLNEVNAAIVSTCELHSKMVLQVPNASTSETGHTWQGSLSLLGGAFVISLRPSCEKLSQIETDKDNFL